MHGFYRVAAAVPVLKVADVNYNLKEILILIDKACRNDCSAICFPELCITGYTCADLFHQEKLITESDKAILDIINYSKNKDIIVIVSAPFHHNSRLYNAAFVIQKGDLKGIIPKSFLPNYREFYEKRWFSSGAGIQHLELNFYDCSTIFGTNLVFRMDEYFSFGIEICEDLWNVIPPSSHQAIAGATLCFNPSASNELVAKADYRHELIKQQSARCMSGYVYTSAGIHESSTDTVYGGHSLIAENGSIIAENERFQSKHTITFADIDCQRLSYTRMTEGSFSDNILKSDNAFREISLLPNNRLEHINRHYTPTPFVPDKQSQRNKRCHEIFNIQTSGLMKRLEHTGSQKAVIGISGGLDSTLALLVTHQAFLKLDRDPQNIVTITMPGFGTTDRTYNNAVKLCESLQTDLRCVDIKESCLLHFKDIGHDPEIHNVTYENVQARERTQVLMNVANRENGLVIGTGDLSEIALGWSTYNGDHISMYSVNCGVPKTLIKYLIEWVADHPEKNLRELLHDIIDTPISPELLPKKKDGKISQKTEDLIGPYVLHDFFLYHCVKYGASPEKIKLIAKLAFQDEFSEAKVSEVLTTFIKRFFNHQFKRSCIPDGPKVGTICLSPRADWRMPSDASSAVWLDNNE